MALRDRFMQKLINAHGKTSSEQERTYTSSSTLTEPLMPHAARLALLFDGIKLIGTGNGAGTLASLAAMYYFASRPELQVTIKAAAVVYAVGLLIFAIALVVYIVGMMNVAIFSERLIEKEVKLSDRTLDSAVDALMMAIGSILGLGASLLCFVVATGIGLYALIRF